jgi:hypothetical protein
VCTSIAATDDEKKIDMQQSVTGKCPLEKTAIHSDEETQRVF